MLSFLEHISRVSPPPMTRIFLTLEPVHTSTQIGLCITGAHLLHQPLQLPCGHHICAQCLRSKAKTAHTLNCTSCDTTHSLVPKSVTPPSSLLLDFVAEQLTKCRACGECVKVRHLDQHISSACTDHISVSVRSVLTKPLSEPLNPFEEKIASNLVRRKISNAKTSTITLKTGGPVREHTHSHIHRMSM